MHNTIENGRLLTPHNGLKVTWFDRWDPLINEALMSLPEVELCPHELYRRLLQNPSPGHKRIALITLKGVPIAVVGLRQRGRYSWEPLTQWMIPGFVFPARPGYLIPSLDALRRDVWVAWWRMEAPPTTSQAIRYLESTPTYKIKCSEDFEQYWRDNGYFKTIRRMRNRTKDFTLVVNSPGSAEWTIKKWEERWRKNPMKADPSLSDRILITKYLEERKCHFTLMLLDQDIPIGGATMIVHNKDLVASVLYNDTNYRSHGVGIRLIDLCFDFAAANNFEIFDIGGGYDYKNKWARKDGERWLFNVCPEPLFKVKQFVNHVRKKSGINLRS